MLDDAGGQRPDAARAGANARTATEDTTAIAYIGELDSGASRTSIPITNEAGLLQVSAGASAVDLTRAAPGSDQPPDEVQPSGTSTFGRVMPSDAAQGEAAAGSMSAGPGIRRVWILGDEARTGRRCDSGSSRSPMHRRSSKVARSTRSTTSPHGPKPAFPRASDRSPALRRRCAGSRHRRGRGCPEGRRSSRGRSRRRSCPPRPTSPTCFRSAYDRPPGRYAAYGYEAMAVVLDCDRPGRRPARPQVGHRLVLRDDGPRVGPRHVLDRRVRGHDAVTGRRVRRRARRHPRAGSPAAHSPLTLRRGCPPSPRRSREAGTS